MPRRTDSRKKPGVSKEERASLFDRLTEKMALDLKQKHAFARQATKLKKVAARTSGSRRSRGA